RSADSSALATLVRVGEGVGPITYSRSPGAHQNLNRELRQRLVTQDLAAVFFLLIILGVAILVSCLGVFQFADDPSQVVFYTDPKHTQQRMICSSRDLESFLEAFNGPPQHATLRLIGRRPTSAVWYFPGFGMFQRMLRRRPRNENIIFDVSLDLTTFIGGEGHLASAREVSKLEAHLTAETNPLEILVLRKRVLWANWEDMATNIKQRLRAKGFLGDLQVRFDAQEDVRIYRNHRWQNFVRTPITHMLSALIATLPFQSQPPSSPNGNRVLSGLGLFIWLPYLYCRSDVVVVESNFQIQLDINRYWEMLSAGLDAEEGFRL
ncbi:unnamed protein product, partial [Durusdinium trenchii]